jgi:hypothetical protein
MQSLPEEAGEEEPMNAVVDCLKTVRLGAAQTHRNLTVLPLLRDGAGEPGYLLLDEVVRQGLARVTEVSAAGSVAELKLVNDADQPVLLLDGEELVGAKQNRILNVTVLAAAHSAVVIPVSCVEAGRWSPLSAEFAPSDRAHFATGRAAKAASVTESLRRDHSRRSDQGEVWQDIAEKSVRMGVESPTGAAALLYEQHRPRLEDFVAAFAPVDGQVGALFAVNGSPWGIDLFDSPATLGKTLPKLVRSYALDAIDVATERDAPLLEQEALRFVADTLGARVDRFPAVGLGEDLRLAAPTLTGGALAVDGRVVHLCAFRLGRAAHRDGHDRGSRVVRASVRRRVN